MEFGKIADVSGINWKLPEDDPRNVTRFGKTSGLMVYLGSPAWASKDWRGKIYPLKCDPGKFLYHYSRNFNCIELNTTHYRIPTPNMTQQWREEVPPHFQFCPKIPQAISHSRQGMCDKDLLFQWNEFLENMGENLGPCFIQFHELFSYSEKHILFKFLENWPERFELTLEFRHASWFQKNKVLPALTDYLHKKGMGLVITDVAGRRDVLHTSLTSKWTMIRLVGNDLHPSDEKRLQDWAERINDWQNKGPERVYLFLHQPDDIWTVEFARMAGHIFRQKGFEDLSPFTLETPRDLFSAV